MPRVPERPQRRRRSARRALARQRAPPRRRRPPGRPRASGGASVGGEHDHRAARRAPRDERRVERQAAPPSRTPPARAGARGPRTSRAVRLRVVGQRGAEAHGHGVAVGPPAVHQARATAGPEIQRLSPVAVAILPSRLVASFSVTSGQPGHRPGQEGGVQLGARAAVGAVGHGDLDARGARAPRAPGRGRARADRRSRSRRARPRPRTRASAHGGRAAVVRAGLQRADHRRAAGRVAGRREGHRLGVRQPRALVPALRDDPPAAQHHRAHQRVGAHAAARRSRPARARAPGRPAPREAARPRRSRRAASAASSR